MKIPVGPHEYEVLMVHGWVKGQDGEDCLGYFDATKHCIYLSDQQSSTEMAVTLGHELMHAWRYHFPCDVQDEEALAEVVGLGFAQFMGAAMAQFADWGRMMGHPDFKRSKANGSRAEARETLQKSNRQDLDLHSTSIEVSQQGQYASIGPKAQAARVMQHGVWQVRIFGD